MKARPVVDDTTDRQHCWFISRSSALDEHSSIFHFRTPSSSTDPCLVRRTYLGICPPLILLLSNSKRIASAEEQAWVSKGLIAHQIIGCTGHARAPRESYVSASATQNGMIAETGVGPLCLFAGSSPA